MTCKFRYAAIIGTLSACAVVVPCYGQSVVTERFAAVPGRPDAVVRVQLSIQMFVNGPTDESEEAERQRERARRSLYELAGRECNVMRDSIARECRLESVNITFNRVPNPQTGGYQISGAMGYQITLK